MDTAKHSELVNRAWAVADLLRGDYKQSDYGKVILPFTVLRRLECVLDPSRDEVRDTIERLRGKDIDLDRFLHMPDPTLMYRRPNAPRPRVRPSAVVSAPATVVDAPAATPTRLRNAIDDAYKQSTELLGQERFAQAADVVRAVIASAGKVLGSESPDLLGLRMHRALILFLGGDARAALPEFDALADAFARTAGPSSSNAFECRRYAAHCRADLGEATAALQQFRGLLDELLSAGAGASDLAIDVRRGIGMLLLSGGDPEAAENVFVPLYADHLALYGEHDERSREIAEILARISFAETSLE